MDEQSHRHGKMTGKFQVLRPSLFTRCTNDPIPQKLLHLYSASLFCVATTCNRGRTTSADTTATSFSWSSIWPALTDLPWSTCSSSEVKVTHPKFPWRWPNFVPRVASIWRSRPWWLSSSGSPRSRIWCSILPPAGQLLGRPARSIAVASLVTSSVTVLCW